MSGRGLNADGAGSQATEIVVSVEHLTRSFGPRRGVTDVSFDVAADGVFGFLGPNGAGKSTTIQLLLGYRTSSPAWSANRR